MGATGERRDRAERDTEEHQNKKKKKTGKETDSVQTDAGVPRKVCNAPRRGLGTYGSELDGTLGSLHEQGSSDTTVDAELLTTEDVEENLEGALALADLQLLDSLDDIKGIHDEALD